MASGKTTTLHRQQQMTMRSRFHKVYSIGCSNNPLNVSRGHVLSRSGGAYEASFVPVLTEELAQSIIDEGYTDVFIDEGQFFDTTGEKELKNFCSALLKGRLSIYVSALNSTYEGEPWPAITHLSTLSPQTQTLTAWCDGEDCGDEAFHTHRISDSTETVDVNAVYISLCRNCWYKMKKC